MNVYFSSGGNSNLDSKRGIGANTDELIAALLETKKIKIVDSINSADIVHFTKFRPYFVDLPLLKPDGQKWVLTIHDLIPLIYLEHYPSGIKGRIRLWINKFLIWKNIDFILTITETSKKDISRFLNFNPEKIAVSYLAKKTAVLKLKSGTFEKKLISKFSLPKRFVLFDHGVNYNKNVPNLIKACRLAGIKLAMVGKETENIGKLDLSHPELSHLKGVDFSDVIKLGYVSDEDLNKLFNLATIYVQPSYYEGFGMPVVEAMSVGCPVICSKTQALVEVAGDACLYFDPNNPKELAEKIKIFLNSERLRNEYIKKGFERVKNFSWKKAAQETLEVYAKSI